MPSPAAARIRRDRAKAHVERIRAMTVCERCGAQPVEWHNDDHSRHPGRRIGRLVSNGMPLEVIDAEIAVCEAVCRPCHFEADGRRPWWLGDREGMANPNVRLTSREVEQIRNDPRFQRVIAAEYGITQGHVSRIKRRAQRREG